MRIAHIDHSTESGGAELALLRLLRHEQRSWQATLTLPRGDSMGAFAPLAGVIPISRSGSEQPPGAATARALESLGHGLRLLRQSLDLRHSDALHSADVVHANTTRSAVYAALALRSTKQAFVVHVRDQISPDSLGALGFNLFKRLVAPRATIFIANSHSTSATVESVAHRRQPVLVVPSPIGIARMATPTQNLRQRVSIGMVARLDPWKGQASVIRAFSLAGLDADASLILFGDTSLGRESFRDELQELVKDLGLQNVRFAGYIEDVTPAIDSLDICIQYSVRPEPLGQNVLQYLSRGRATIVADEGGPAEWVTHDANGWVVPPRDERALAAALRQLVASPALRERLGRAATQTPGLIDDSEVVRLHAEAFDQALRAAR